MRFVDVDSRPVCRATIGLVVSHFNLHLLALARQRLNVAELYQMLGVVEGISPGATLPKLEAMYKDIHAHPELSMQGVLVLWQRPGIVKSRKVSSMSADIDR